MTPPALDHAVQTCLAKDPDDRWQSAGDVKRQLQWIAGTVGQPAGAGALPARRALRERLAWSLAALALLLAAAAIARGALAPVASSRPMSLSVALPEKSALRAAVLSPDGTRMVVVAKDTSGRNLLWIRSLDAPAIQPLPGTDNPSFPFWSPDGRFIGFFADGKLKKIDATGGPPQTLCDASSSRGGTWSTDGTILFTPFADGPLYKVASTGGAPTAVTRFDPRRGETSHRWPYFLPDGRRFLYLVASFGSSREREGMGIYAASLDSKEEKFLVRANSSLAYAPPGYLLFVREGNLLAQSFDPQALRVSGDPVPVAEGIEQFAQIYNSLFSVSANGILLYQNRTASTIARLLWLDRSGKTVGSLGAAADQASPRISPDGRRVALHIADPRTGNVDIWAYETSGAIAARLSSLTGTEAAPSWAPDGSRIAFTSNQEGHPDLYVMSSSGGGGEELVLRSERSKIVTDWSPDARFLLFRAADASSKFELWIVPIAGDRKPNPFIQAPFSVSDGQFSPDGRYVAYASNESGRWEIYVTPFPGPGGNWKVSTDGGAEPRWRRDGKELYYVTPDGVLMAVAVRLTPTFDADAPKSLFPIRRREAVATLDLFTYDVSPDGQRFLVNTDVGETTTQPLTIVLDWTSRFRR
jgi:Tol biopolymer transport system component